MFTAISSTELIETPYNSKTTCLQTNTLKCRSMKIKASRCIDFHLSFEEPVVDSMKDWERDSNL